MKIAVFGLCASVDIRLLPGAGALIAKAPRCHSMGLGLMKDEIFHVLILNSKIDT